MLIEKVGTLIKGILNGEILYTEEYVLRQKSVMLGYLEASVKPIILAQIIKARDFKSM